MDGTDERVEIVERLLEAYDAHDAKAFAACCAEGVVVEERVTDGPFGDHARAVAICHVDGDGSIDRVRFLS